MTPRFFVILISKFYEKFCDILIKTGFISIFQRLKLRYFAIELFNEIHDISSISFVEVYAAAVGKVIRAHIYIAESCGLESFSCPLPDAILLTNRQLIGTWRKVMRDKNNKLILHPISSRLLAITTGHSSLKAIYLYSE